MQNKKGDAGDKGFPENLWGGGLAEVDPLRTLLYLVTCVTYLEIDNIVSYYLARTEFLAKVTTRK